MQTDNGNACKAFLKRDAVICVLLAAAVLAVFWNVRGFEFTGYDDDHYVSNNSRVNKGLTLQSIWWAFTTGYFSYWHPLTWISHMLDVQLFGLNAGAHHLMSVFIHILNSICLYLGLKYITASWERARSWRRCLRCIPPTSSPSRGLLSARTC